MSDTEMASVVESMGFEVLVRQELAGREPAYFELPQGLGGELVDHVRKQYPGGLYGHQAAVIRAALEGRDVAISTATASGKSLSFALPAMQALLDNPRAVCLLLYPTKALASDQLEPLKRLCSAAGLDDVVFRFDGDIQGDDRDRALANGRLFLTNADMLHMTLLRRNNDASYARLWSNLRVVVLDECHVYRGAFGANMAYVLRRMEQVCLNHGSEPQFLAASATSSDPAAHLRSLTGRDFEVVGESENTSGQAERLFMLAKPAEGMGLSDGALVLMKAMVESGRRFVVFAETRKATENLTVEFAEEYPDLAGRVLPYRAGYEAADRHSIESQLHDGTLAGVISTSALELGVDIPAMDVCVMLGIPGSVMSFWQRAGRVGRDKDRPGTVIVIPGKSAVDSFYVAHPDRFMSRNLENLIVQVDNRKLIIDHLACARAERKTGTSAKSWRPSTAVFGEDFVDFASRLETLDLDDPILVSPEPHFEVGIRGVDDPTFKILNPDPRMDRDLAMRHAEQRPLGSLSYSQLLREAYTGAIYLHMGRPYRVKRVKYHDHQVVVEPEKNKGRMTFPIVDVRVTPKVSPSPNIFRRRESASLVLWHTMMSVRTSTSGYRERAGQEWVDNKVYASPLSRRVETEGVWLQIDPELGPRTTAGLNAAAHAIGNIYALVKPCEPTDIATHAVVRSGDGSSRIYIYDTVAGGLGITARAFDSIEELLKLALERLESCPHCSELGEDAGCPACAQSSRWGERDSEASRVEGADLLKRLLADLAGGGSTFTSEGYRRREQGGLSSVEQDALIEQMTARRDSFARRYFREGTILRTPTGFEAPVVETYLRGRDRAYVLDDGRSVKEFLDTGLLELAEGEIQKECMACGAVGLDVDIEVCEGCGANIAW